MKYLRSARDNNLKRLIANPKINAEKKSRQDHHHGGAVDFLLARPSHPLRFHSYFVDILPDRCQSSLGMFQGNLQRCYLS